jgi:hypothetical protein
VWNLARAQAAAGLDVTVLTTDVLAPHERLPAGATCLDGVRIVRVRNVSGFIRSWLHVSTPLRFGRHARHVFQTTRPDIVHLHELRTVENWFVVRAAPASVPVVVSTHGGTAATVRARSGVARIRDWLLSAVFRRIDHIVIEPDEAIETLNTFWAAQRLALDRVSVAPNGAEPASSITMSRAARRLAEQHTWQNVAAAMTRIYEQVIASRAAT